MTIEVNGSAASAAQLRSLATSLTAAPATAETVGRALAATDDVQCIALNAATTQTFTLAASVAITRHVEFRQVGLGSIQLTVPAGVKVNGVDGSVTPTYTLTNVQWTVAVLLRLAAADEYMLA